MKTAIRLSALAALAMGLAACTQDDPAQVGPAQVDGPQPLQVYAGVGSATKAVDETWSVGDMIGITAVTESYSDTYRNACYVLDSDEPTTSGHFVALSEDHEISLEGGGAVEFTAYGPYQTSDDAATLPSDGGCITVDLSSQTTLADQEAVDFIFARATQVSGNNVNFTFNHVMSKLVIQILAGEGLTAEDILSEDNALTLDGPGTSGNFYVATGATEAAGASSSWDPRSTMLQEEIEGGFQFSAILFPQEVPSLTFTVIFGEEIYTVVAELEVPDGGFEAGQSYIYTVTLNDTHADTTAIVTESIN